MTLNKETGDAAIVAELARVKAHFQLRTIAMVVGAPMPAPPKPLHSEPSR